MYSSKLLKPTDFDTQGVITSGTRSGHLHQFSILFFAVPDVPGDLLGILRPLGAKLEPPTIWLASACPCWPPGQIVKVIHSD